MRRFQFGFTAVIAILILTPTLVLGQAPPESLRFTVPESTFKAEGNRLDTNATIPTNSCAPKLQSPAQTPVSQAYKLTPPFNGSYRPGDGAIPINLRFTAGDLAEQYATSGFTVQATLKYGSAVIGSASANVTAASAPPSTPTQLSISPNTAVNGSQTGDIEVTITLTATSPGPSLPGAPGQNVALQCGTSKAGPFNLIRGPPGAEDLDADGLADPEDQDMDGDGVPNATEAGLQCMIDGNAVDLSRERAEQPGDHDGDGVSDEEECSKNSDPLDNLIVPAGPTPFPWGLLILAILLLIVIAAVVFFFTVYGKAAAITLVTASELVIPPGTQGKYQLQVQNLRKKGNPINFQLSTQGLPDGWDAKLQPDHAVLDPVGGAKNTETVWLHVESPQHTDPESAVVKVKAIALNAAGRKDTLKLPASVSTITSINVPPNAKVPVKRGAPVKIKSEKELAKEAAAAAPPAEGGMAPTPVTAAEAPPEEAPKGKKAKKGKAPEPAPAPAPAAPPAPAPGGKPALQVGGLAHTPPSFAAGQDVKSMVTVTNNGNDPQTLKLSLFVNDALADAQTVSVKPGKSKEVKFKWTAQERNKLNIRGELVAG